MSQFSTEWIVEGRVLHVHLIGQITGDELIRYDEEVVAMLDHAGTVGPVHFVEDIGGLTNAPPLSVSLRLKMMRDPRLGWSVSIGAVKNPWLRLVYQSLVMIMSIHWRDVISIEQALQYLNHVDASLPDLTGWTKKEEV